jgi:hypothetical protein
MAVILHPLGGGDILGVVDLAGAPEFGAVARDAARFNAVRSLISSRSYSARDPRTPIIIRPAGVEESIPSLVDTNVTPRSVNSLTVCRM